MLDLNAIKNIYQSEMSPDWFFVTDINDNYFIFKKDSEPHFELKTKPLDDLKRIIGIEKIKGTPLFNYFQKKMELNRAETEQEAQKMLREMKNTGVFQVVVSHINSHLTGPRVIRQFKNEWDANQFCDKMISDTHKSVRQVR